MPTEECVQLLKVGDDKGLNVSIPNSTTLILFILLFLLLLPIPYSSKLMIIRVQGLMNLACFESLDPFLLHYQHSVILNVRFSEGSRGAFAP